MLPSEGAFPLIHACHFDDKQQPQNTAKSELKRAGRATTGPSRKYGSQPPRRLHTDGVTPILVRIKKVSTPVCSIHSHPHLCPPSLTCCTCACTCTFSAYGRGGGVAVPPRSDFRVFNVNIRHNPQSLNPGDKVTPPLLLLWLF